MADLRALAADLRKQLAEVESKIKAKEMDFNSQVAAMDECPVWKKRAMDPHGFVYNVCELLNDGYQYMCEEYGGKTLRSVAGKPGTDKWEDFQLRVIQHLKDTGVFGSDDYFEDFEDTAGGCDEVLQDETDNVIKKMLKEQKVQVD